MGPQLLVTLQLVLQRKLKKCKSVDITPHPALTLSILLVTFIITPELATASLFSLSSP